MSFQSRLLNYTVFSLVAVTSVAFFFRFQIANGFTILFGDRYDAMIEISILQHWANVLNGREPWNVMQYFYPAKDTLGYNDSYFVYGIIYYGLRILGIPIVAAADAVHVIMKLFGFIGMFLVLRLIGRCGFGWSLFGASLFTIADLTLQHANHGQLFTLAFVPYALLLAWRTARSLLATDRASLLAYGTAFLVLYGAWISTAYYLAWFFTLFGLIAITVLAAILDSGRRQEVFSAVKLCRPQLACLAIIGIAVLAPFLAVYMPKSSETGMHAYAEARPTTFMPLDYFNTTRTNIVWGIPLDWLRQTIAPKLKVNHDDIFGLAPLLFGLALWTAIRYRNARAGTVVSAISITTLISWILMLKLFKFSIWRIVYAVVPGAAGIRVVGRFDLLLLLPAVLLVTILLDRSRNKSVAVAIAALLLVEEGNMSAPVQLDQRDQLAMLANIPPPPAACESFYVVSARSHYAISDPVNDHLYAHNVDAMIISEVFERPTVNGYSTFMPPHWNFDNPLSTDYTLRVRNYAHEMNIKPPCLIDVQHGQYWAAMPKQIHEP